VRNYIRGFANGARISPQEASKQIASLKIESIAERDYYDGFCDGIAFAEDQNVTAIARHDNAEIWLQEDEEEGTADCGCRLIDDEEGARIIMCNKHKAADQLLAACRAVIANWESGDLAAAARLCAAAISEVGKSTK
jgi:hypothetical protein